MDKIIRGDVNEDCYIDLLDVRAMVANWLKYTDPWNGYCDQY